MLKEFRDFAFKGNMVDLAVGVIIGASFGTVIKSLVEDIIMPPIGLLLGNVDFTNLFIVIKKGSTPLPYYSAEEAIKAGAVLIKYGSFINNLVSFLIIAFCVFMVIKKLNQFKKETV